VTAERVVEGAVRVEGDTIVGVEPRKGSPPVKSPWILPGFVDMHCHGGGGHSFLAGDPAAARGAAAFHLRHGTTTMLASLVSAPYEQTREATAALAPLVDDGVIAGVHLEGPYLSLRRCGAQHPNHLRDPSTQELNELIELAGPAIRMVTLAPELPGALATITLLVEGGVVAAVGHTDASYEQAREAVAAGVSVATHLFNGMPPVHHRDPGPVLALLEADTVTCELIADGVHLHEATLAFAAGYAGPHRTALVTDALDAAGMPDGSYEFSGQAVTVAHGVARLAAAGASEGALAGSTLTMDAALRRTVAAGVPLVDAARMAATTPARVVGLADRVGAVAAGLRADLVELDQHLRVTRVMRAGRWLAP
jgi:N-acetylglucosamine-6-phosphate deacetylase